MAYIYSITNLINNKQYVGKTTKDNPYDRWKQHVRLGTNKNNLKENNTAHSMPIIRAISKYGHLNFKFRVIEECNDNIVNEREEYWIKELNTIDDGYNCTFGGEGVKKPKKYWANHPKSKAISCYTLDGKWIKDYDSVGLAAIDIANDDRELADKYKNSIFACASEITYQSGGYRWAFKGEELKDLNKRVNRRGKVYGINPSLGITKEWNSQADAAEYINGSRKNNLIIGASLNSPMDNKYQAKGWYLFRDEIPKKWKPAKRNAFDSKRAKELAKLSNQKRKVKVKAVHYIDHDKVLYFDSISEASFFLKGEGNSSASANILNCIKNIESGKIWAQAYGYRWFKA